MAQPAPDLDLGERLIQTALEVLADEGLGGLSLRAIARRAGVSHGAPLRHFNGFADLRSEVAARGFRILSDAIDAGADELPTGAGAIARLRAAGRAYVCVASDNPDLFALMFHPLELDPDNPSFVTEAGHAFQRLVRHVRAAQEAGFHEDRDTLLLAGSVWASVHGLAALWAQGAYQGAVGPATSFEDAVETALDLFIDSRERPARSNSGGSS